MVQADVAKVEEIEHLFEAALSAFGRIDTVVANAGVELVGVPTTDFSEEQFDRLFSINAKGAFFTMQSVAKHVANNGRIIYIGSRATG